MSQTPLVKITQYATVPGSAVACPEPSPTSLGSAHEKEEGKARGATGPRDIMEIPAAAPLCLSRPHWEMQRGPP